MKGAKKATVPLSGALLTSLLANLNEAQCEALWHALPFSDRVEALPDDLPRTHGGSVMTAEQLADLAFDLADEAAAGLIDSETLEIESEGEKWLAFDSFEIVDAYENEIDYLEARGLLHRHPARRDLIRLEDGWR